MKRKMMLSCLLGFSLAASASIAGTWTEGSAYTLHSTGIDPNFTIRRSVNWTGHSNASSEWLGVLNIDVWALGKYNQGTQYLLGSLKTLCVDLDHTVYIPGTWDATWRTGLNNDKPSGLKDSSLENNVASWNRLTYVISNNGAWYNTGASEQKSGMQLAVWELLNGDSRSGTDINWSTSGNFKVTAVGSDDAVISAAEGYLDSTANIGAWSGANNGWWSSLIRQDQVVIPGVGYSPTPPVQAVPETSTAIGFGAALILNGLGIAGSGYYVRRRYNRESARRYAGRQAVRMPMFLDTLVSVLVLLAVSPVLMTVAASGALRSGSPRVYSCSRSGETSKSETADA